MFSIVTIVISFKLKKYCDNGGTATCNLYFNVPETSLWSSTIKQSNSPFYPQFLLKFLKSYKNKQIFLWVAPCGTDSREIPLVSQSNHPKKLLKNSWFVIFGEFLRNCLLKSSIRCGAALWISTSVYVTPFSM